MSFRVQNNEVLERFKLTPERVIHVAWLCFLVGYKDKSFRLSLNQLEAILQLNMTLCAFFTVLVIHCSYYPLFLLSGFCWWQKKGRF